MEDALTAAKRQGDQHQERDTRWALLLAQSAEGNSDAFGQFYRESASTALAVVRRVTGGAFAEDVLADAYLQAWRDVASFDKQRGRACAWLLTMCKSRAIDRLRHEKLRQTEVLTDGEVSEGQRVFQPASDLPGPDAVLTSTQAHSHLHRALAELNATERWVLGLAYFKDLSQSEIATVTRLPLGTVKSTMSRAQHKLRLALAHSWESK